MLILNLYKIFQQGIIVKVIKSHFMIISTLKKNINK